jgi:hypothetical protein
MWREAEISLHFADKNVSSFAEKVLKALKGEKGLVEPSYVYLPGVPGGKEIAEKTGVDFFSVPIELGVCNHPQPTPSSHVLHVLTTSP